MRVLTDLPEPGVVAVHVGGSSISPYGSTALLHCTTLFATNCTAVQPAGSNAQQERPNSIRHAALTLKLLQPSTTATMFLPMSCTSPLTVAMTNTPALLSTDMSPPILRFSSSMNGMRWPTARFITRADLMT
eukprot:GHRQ01036590.1.p1 GENE.GHRQ01036590.1~~GHRQ01036590.1.p1  ORF type:complete len:132 (+),score=10.57 GHRQ01036590.1:143-538(+)